MAVRRVLTRLLRLRELEEEQSRLELETAVGERNRAQRAMTAIGERHAHGRRSFVAGIGEWDTAGRNGGVMEMEAARTLRRNLDPILKAADVEVARQREEFLIRRTGRLQVETLVDNARASAEIEAGRRAQQILDDWYGRRGKAESIPPRLEPVSSHPETDADFFDFGSAPVKSTSSGS